MKLSELISGPQFCGEVVIMEPDETSGDNCTYKEVFHKCVYSRIEASEIPPRLLVYTVRGIACHPGEKLRSAIYFYCAPY